METVFELKLGVTLICKDTESGDLPMGADDQADLAAKLKAAIGADHLDIAGFKSFELDEEG